MIFAASTSLSVSLRSLTHAIGVGFCSLLFILAFNSGIDAAVNVVVEPSTIDLASGNPTNVSVKLVNDDDTKPISSFIFYLTVDPSAVNISQLTAGSDITNWGTPLSPLEIYQNQQVRVAMGTVDPSLYLGVGEHTVVTFQIAPAADNTQTSSSIVFAPDLKDPDRVTKIKSDLSTVTGELRGADIILSANQGEQAVPAINLTTESTNIVTGQSTDLNVILQNPQAEPIESVQVKIDIPTGIEINQIQTNLSGWRELSKIESNGQVVLSYTTDSGSRTDESLNIATIKFTPTTAGDKRFDIAADTKVYFNGTNHTITGQSTVFTVQQANDPTKSELTIKARWQGIFSQRPEQPMALTLMKDGQPVQNATTNCTVDPNGIFTCIYQNLVSDTYQVYLKGESTLQRDLGMVTLTAGESTTLDQSTVDKQLLTGDINDTNTITFDDFLGRVNGQPSGILTFYNDLRTVVAADNPADVNRDGYITIEDLAWPLSNYTSLTVFGDPQPTNQAEIEVSLSAAESNVAIGQSSALRVRLNNPDAHAIESFLIKIDLPDGVRIDSITKNLSGWEELSRVESNGQVVLSYTTSTGTNSDTNLDVATINFTPTSLGVKQFDVNAASNVYVNRQGITLTGSSIAVAVYETDSRSVLGVNLTANPATLQTNQSGAIQIQLNNPDAGEVDSLIINVDLPEGIRVDTIDSNLTGWNELAKVESNGRVVFSYTTQIGANANTDTTLNIGTINYTAETSGTKQFSLTTDSKVFINGQLTPLTGSAATVTVSDSQSHNASVRLEPSPISLTTGQQGTINISLSNPDRKPVESLYVRVILPEGVTIDQLQKNLDTNWSELARTHLNGQAVFSYTTATSDITNTDSSLNIGTITFTANTPGSKQFAVSGNSTIYVEGQQSNLTGNSTSVEVN